MAGEPWRNLNEHWEWLSPSLPVALLGWLLRRRGIRPWQALVHQGRLNRELESCRQDLASCEESRESEARGRRAAIVALEEMVRAGSLVARAVEEGQLTTAASSSAPSTSRPSSSRSRRGRKRNPLEIP